MSLAFRIRFWIAGNLLRLAIHLTNGPGSYALALAFHDLAEEFDNCVRTEASKRR